MIFVALRNHPVARFALSSYLQHMKTPIIIFAAGLSIVQGPAVYAEDMDLPGVKTPEAIVKAPEPEPSDADSDPRSFRIGNTDVRISGDVTIDVNIGDLKSNPRR
ncbi:MAG: hypothetical protein M9944_08155 [Rhizobiaceae bacterium]|nr:hypothetical protein [Rhizobiaceae bacterium]